MSDTIPQETPQKQCTKCLQYKDATSQYFPSDKRNRDGFHHNCKECINAYNRRYRKDGGIKETLPEGHKRCPRCKNLLALTHEFFHYNRTSHDGFQAYCKSCFKRTRKGSIVNGMKKCADCHEVFPATLEYFHARRDRRSGLQSKCKACQKAKDAQRVRPKESKESHHQRYMRTRETYLQRRFIYYREHIEAYQIYYAQYRQTHIEQCKANGHNRRARARAARGKHNAADIRKQYANQKGKCYYCGVQLGRGKRDYQVDHIVPLSRGGSNDPSNLVIACPPCNQSKKAKFLHEWTKGGRLL